MIRILTLGLPLIEDRPKRMLLDALQRVSSEEELVVLSDAVSNFELLGPTARTLPDTSPAPSMQLQEQS